MVFEYFGSESRISNGVMVYFLLKITKWGKGRARENTKPDLTLSAVNSASNPTIDLSLSSFFLVKMRNKKRA